MTQILRYLARKTAFYRASLWFPTASAVLLSLTLPIIHWSLFAWFGLVPFFLFLSAKHLPVKKAIQGMLLFGIILGFMVIFPLLSVSAAWLSYGISSFQPYLLLRILFFPIVALFAGFLGSLFFAPFYFAYRRYNKGFLAALFISSIFVVIEFIRSTYGFFGFSWGVFGYALIDVPFITSAAHLPGGVLVLSFIILLANFTFSEIIDNAISEKIPNQEQGWRKLNQYSSHILCIGLLLILPLIGKISSSNVSCTNLPTRVAVISTTITTEESNNEASYTFFKKKILIALEEGAKLVLLPENVFPFMEIDEDTQYPTNPIAIGIQPTGRLFDDLLSVSMDFPNASLALGLHTVQGTKHFNSLVVIKNGAISSIYRKNHLVPFAEYKPKFTPPLFPSYEHLSAGSPTDSFHIGNSAANALICSEIGVLPIHVTQGNPPNIILSPSNDGVFSSQYAAITHHMFARMRAIEAHAYLLRSSKGGISSIIDPEGHVLTQGQSNEILFADIFLQCSAKNP